MKTIAIACQKGGVGKSTLATNLASAFVDAGKNVAILDLDPQGTSYSWGERRAAGGTDLPVVLSVQAVALGRELKRMADAGCDVAIIDTRGAGDTAASTAVKMADLVLIPSRPSFADVEAIWQTLDMTNQAGKPTFVFLNACEHQGRDAEFAAEAIGEAGASVADVRVKVRVAFKRALAEGKSVMEYEPRDSAAVAEVRGLYDFTCEKLGIAA